MKQGSTKRDISVTDIHEDESNITATTPVARPVASAALNKRVPKIKVQHRSKEFTVLRTLMHEINSQKVPTGVTVDDSISTR